MPRETSTANPAEIQEQRIFRLPRADAHEFGFHRNRFPCRAREHCPTRVLCRVVQARKYAPLPVQICLPNGRKWTLSTFSVLALACETAKEWPARVDGILSYAALPGDRASTIRADQFAHPSTPAIDAR